MYTIDHEILQYKTVLNNLNRELPLAVKWETEDQSIRTPYYKPTFLSKVSLSIIERLYEKKYSVNTLIASKPKDLLLVVIARLPGHLQKLEEEKAERLQSWRQCCAQNFMKSLDHRSFSFKEAQKKQLQQKRQI